MIESIFLFLFGLVAGIIVGIIGIFIVSIFLKPKKSISPDQLLLESSKFPKEAEKGIIDWLNHIDKDQEYRFLPLFKVLRERRGKGLKGSNKILKTYLNLLIEKGIFVQEADNYKLQDNWQELFEEMQK